MKLTLHPLFLIYAITITLFGGLFTLLSALFAVLIHETAHAKVAYSRGYDIGEIVLMPYGATLNLGGKLDERDAVAVLSAGIIANFGFTFIIISIWWLIPAIYTYTLSIVIANVAIGLINMIPAMPLDGGRLLAVFVKNKKILKFINTLIISVTFVFLIVLFIISCFSNINFSTLILAIFLLAYLLCSKQNNTLELFNTKRNFTEIKEVIINEKTPLYKLIKAAKQKNYSKFIIQNGKGKTIGCIEENKLQEYAVSYPADTKVGDII